MTIAIVLEFEDDDEAKHFANAYFQYQDLYNDHDDWQTQAELISAVKVPESFCECGIAGQKSYKQGTVWGWWVCSLCNKPSKFFKDKHLDTNNAFNLIPEELWPAQMNHLKGYQRSTKEWRFLVDGSLEDPTG